MLPIVYSAPHASNDFGLYTPRCALTAEQQFRFADYGTDLTLPRNGKHIVSEYSRALAGLNQPPESPLLYPWLDYAQPERHPVWKINEGLTEDEKKYNFETMYIPYHNRLKELIQTQAEPSLVIDWHNTAHYIIGTDASGTEQMMKPIILSNQGDENSAKGSNTTCDPELLETVADIFQSELKKHNLPHEIYFNHVYKGGYITQTYNTFRNPDLHSYPVQSFQVEYDTIITHNQITLEPHKENIIKLQEAFEIAIELTLQNYML